MAEWVEKGSIKGPPGEIPDVSDFLRDGDVSSAISGSAEKVASDKAVKDYVDAQVSSEATSRQEQDATLLAQIGGKANVKHSHEMTDVTGLNDKISEIETSVSGKANATHTHTTSQVDGLDTKLSQIDTNISGKADAVHTHTIENVTGLQDALDGKSATGHTHTSAEVTDLQGKLDAKADSVHTHAISEVTDLQTTLDGKAAAKHVHEITEVTGLQTALDGKVDEGSITLASLGVTADAAELNYMDGVTSGVQAQLDGKAASSHTHATSDVTGLDTALAGKANVAHEHGAEDIVSGTLSVDRIPTIPDSKITGMSADKLTGTIPSDNLPSYVDDVIEVDNYDALPPTGEAGKIYVDKETNKTYRWGGSAYVEISASLALGETSATAFRGDYGKVAYDHAQAKGSEFATGFYKITTNAEGHVTSATAVTKGDITALGVPAQDTTYVDATTSASGLMSAADKTKLNGIANGANNYTHPTSAAGALGSNIYKITTDANGHIIAATPIAKGDITALGIPSEDTDTTYTAGSGLALSGTEFGIADGGVIGRHLDDNCVMERNIAVGAVTSDKIPALAITTPKLVDNAVTAIKMADDAVATRSIQDGAVTADKIADGVIPESVSYDVATSEADGLMSSTDKTALDNLKTNAVTTDASGYVQKSPFKFKNSDSSVEMNFTSKTETSLDLEFRTTTGTDVVTISADNLFGEASGGIAMGTGATFDMGGKEVNGIVDAVGEGADGTKLVTDKAVKDAIAAIKIPDPLPAGGTDGQVLTKTADGEAWEDIPDYENATTEYDGLMSAADKTKLDGISDGANNYVHPASAAGAKASGLYKVQTDANGHVIGAVNVAKNDITALGIPAQDTTYVDATTGASGLMSAADKTKLDGMDTALAGKSDVGHTHEIANVNGLQDALGSKAASGHKHDASDITTGTMSVDRLPSITDDKISSVSAEKITGTIPSENLPSYVDDVIEVENYAALPPTGEAGKIYVDKETNKTYRWGGSDYVEISASLALGETSATAFRGDYGKAAYDHAQSKGSEFASGLYKIATNSEGHVTGAVAVQKSDITALGVPAQDTTYVDATGSASGLMSAADKSKLDGIAEGADKLPDGGTNGQILTKTASGEAWQDAPEPDLTGVLTINDSNQLVEHGGTVVSDLKLTAAAGVASISAANDACKIETLLNLTGNASKTTLESSHGAFQIGGTTGRGANLSVSGTDDEVNLQLTSIGLDSIAMTVSDSGASFGIGSKSVNSITDTIADSPAGSALVTDKAVADYVTAKVPSVVPINRGGTGVTSEDALVQLVFNSMSTPKASATQYGVVKFASDEDFKAFMSIS